MSESVRPSSSQTAMSIAFKKARRKFPKNFGLNSSHAEKESSESEEDSSNCKNEQEAKSPKSPLISLDPINDQIYEKSIAECIESELVDSFKEVKLSEEPEIICDLCQAQPENYVGVDLKLDHPVSDEHEKCESAYLEKQDFAYDYEYENELPSKPDPSNYTYHETRHNTGLIWNGESDHCDNYDSVIEETPTGKYNDETPTRRKRQSYRRKKNSHYRSDYIHHKDEHFEYPTSCPCHEYCAHCQHYYRHCSCCRAHYCCCNPYCMIWHDRAVTAHEACPTCRRQRSKKKRCSTCNGKRRSSSPSIPCSRDSGIFTQTRFEDYDDDEEDASATLMHKDSLSILQEKYAKRNGRRKDEDEEERAKGRKTCKRVSSRYSYY